MLNTNNSIPGHWVLTKSKIKLMEQSVLGMEQSFQTWHTIHHASDSTPNGRRSTHTRMAENQ